MLIRAWLMVVAMGLMLLAAPLARAAQQSDESSRSAKVRVAVLNFGPPRDWNGSVADTIGVTVAPEAWREVIPLLEKDRVRVVVVRARSGGGPEAAVRAFSELFEKEFVPRFRMVVWIDSFVGFMPPAVVAVLPIEEFYMLPGGVVGTCLPFLVCPMRSVQDPLLERQLASADRAARLGHHSPEVVRAMMIQEPLSADVDAATGAVLWRNDERGQWVLNRKEEICTLSSADAVRFRFVRATAATREELMRAMGLESVEWAGAEASAAIDASMRSLDVAFERVHADVVRYDTLVGGVRTAEISDVTDDTLASAKKLLAGVREALERHPTWGRVMCIDGLWVNQQSERLAALERARRGKGSGAAPSRDDTSPKAAPRR